MIFNKPKVNGGEGRGVDCSTADMYSNVFPQLVSQLIQKPIVLLWNHFFYTNHFLSTCKNIITLNDCDTQQSKTIIFYTMFFIYFILSSRDY